MDTIKLTKYYDEPKEKYNIISVVVFKLRNSYKSVKIYLDGLKKLVKEVPKKFKGYYLRVYFDDSIITPEHGNKTINDDIKNNWIPLFDEMKKLKYVQLTHYEHPEFKVDKTIYHDGVYGMLVRMMPIFDYKDNDKINIVFISDIDSPEYVLDNGHKHLKFMADNKTVLHFNTRTCYSVQPRYDMITDEEFGKFPYAMMGGTIITKIKFPHELLDNLLKCMTNLTTKECEVVKQFIEHEQKVAYKSNAILDMNIKSKFVYGIDEFLLEKYITQYIVDNKIPYSYYVRNSSDKVLHNWYTRTNHFKKSNSKNSKYTKYQELMKRIMGKYYDDTKTVEENFNIMDKFTYQKFTKKNDTEKKQYFYDNIFAVFKELEEKGNYADYDIRWREVKCINLYPTLKSDIIAVHP
jgi:hypothetical protein